MVYGLVDTGNHTYSNSPSTRFEVYESSVYESEVLILKLAAALALRTIKALGLEIFSQRCKTGPRKATVGDRSRSNTY